MKIFIVYAHPEPQSINGAMFRTALETLTEAGHTVHTSDLYAMQFNPISNRHNFTSVKDPLYFKQQFEEMYAAEVGGFAPLIEEELQKVEACDVMIWQFPLWWFSVPAILKGWADRVFAMGRTYGSGRFYENGVFKNKKALLSVTTGGAEESYLPDGFNGDLPGILRPIQRGILQFTGFSVLRPHVIYGPVRQTPEELRQVLENWKIRLLNIGQEEPINVGRY
jgi:NAD(P)H dehydrogenase (quinone)